MRIAFIYDMMYPFHIGGVEIRNHHIAKRLAKKHDVHMIGVKMWDGPDVIKKDGITYHGICRYKQLYSFDNTRRIIDPLVFAWKLFFYLQKWSFDCIDTSAFVYLHLASVYLAKKKAKLIITWHQYWGSYWHSYKPGIIGLIGRFIEYLCTKIPAHHIAISKTTQKDLATRGVASELIYNGAETTEIKRKSKKYDICFIGRITHQKNVGVLQAAMRLLPHYSCIIIGDGPDKAFLQQHASENITYTGFVKREKVLAYLSQSKLFVLPSLLEGFGIVVIEAKAAGIPSIVVKNKWNASMELIDDDGLICENNPRALAKAITKILEDKSVYQRMAKRAKNNATLFDWNKAAELLESRMKQLISK